MPGTRSGARLFAMVLAVGLMSGSVLVFEVALTRIFSVMLSYHFVFAILSGAMLGLGLGGAAFRRWGSGPSSLLAGASAYALLSVGAILIILLLPVHQSTFLASLGFWLYLALAILPFGAAGFVLAGIFQSWADHSALLYGADLAGAAIGAFSVVPLMDRMGAVDAVVVAGAVAAAGALALGWATRRMSRMAITAAVALAVLLVSLPWTGQWIRVPVSRDPDKDMSRMLSNPDYQAHILESRWSSFGRTDLVKSERLPNEMTIFVDGAAGSSMYNLPEIRRNPEEAAHLTHTFSEYFPLSILSPDQKRSALVIGPGGGRDVVVALLAGVGKIHAVEVNPDVVSIVKDYRTFNGGLYTDLPEVTTVVAEGRNYVRNASGTWDLIMLSIPIIKSSRSVEGYALTENYLFTVEALADYLGHLTPDGRIVIVTHDVPEIFRLISTALKTFGAQGMSEPEAMTHMYTVASEMMPALVIQKQALQPQEATRIHAGLHHVGCNRAGFFVPFIPQAGIRPEEQLGAGRETYMFDRFLAAISEGKLRMDDLVDTVSIDISPVRDDRPFFYKFEPGLPYPFGIFSFLIAGALGGLLLLLLLSVRSRVTPRRVTLVDQLRAHPPLKGFLLIFAALGTGYMVIEIALFQKLMLYIGHPQQALTVLLFALLLGSGLGSVASGRIRPGSTRVIGFLSFGVALFALMLVFGLRVPFGLGWDPRLAATAAILPLGFLMGFPFPFALRQMAAQGFTDRVSTMWGINGVASILGSALAMIIGLLAGFSLALAVGGLLYIPAGLVFFRGFRD